MALACVLGLVASAALVAPAQAAPTYIRYMNSYNSKCLKGEDRDEELFTSDCSTRTYFQWQVESRPQSGTSNEVVKLRNRASGRCLDSRGGNTGAAVWNIGCNTGNNQLWEVFYQSNGARVFKSWGAWRANGRHLCLFSEYSIATLKTCDAGSAKQQWIRQDA
jgi:hypothetical protein